MIEPVDIHGEHLKVGDWVGWAHTVGSSRMKRRAALTTGRIKSICFSDDNRRCPQFAAKRFTLTIEVERSTGNGICPTRVIVNVQNVVKLKVPFLGG